MAGRTSLLSHLVNASVSPVAPGIFSPEQVPTDIEDLDLLTEAGDLIFTEDGAHFLITGLANLATENDNEILTEDGLLIWE